MSLANAIPLLRIAAWLKRIHQEIAILTLLKAEEIAILQRLHPLRTVPTRKVEMGVATVGDFNTGYELERQRERGGGFDDNAA